MRDGGGIAPWGAIDDYRKPARKEGAGGRSSKKYIPSRELTSLNLRYQTVNAKKPFKERGDLNQYLGGLFLQREREATTVR